MQNQINSDGLRADRTSENRIIRFPPITADLFSSAGQLFHLQSSFRNTEEVNRPAVNYINVGHYRNQILVFSLLLFFNYIMI